MISRRAENRRSLPEDISVQEKPKGFKIRRSSFTQKLHIYWRYIFVLLIGWLLLIQYYERTVVKRAMKKCDWDQWEEWDSKVVAHRVGLYADPQIMDLYSYPSRPTIVNWFTRQILDNYHARNWKFFHYYMKPDSVFFLGDLFDGGRNWEVNEWITEYKRFNSIFPKKPGHLTVMSLPGNHDIGFGDTIIESSLERFTTFFGDLSLLFFMVIQYQVRLSKGTHHYGTIFGAIIFRKVMTQLFQCALDCLMSLDMSTILNRSLQKAVDTINGLK